MGLTGEKASHLDRKFADQLPIISLVFGLFNLRNTIIQSIRRYKQNQTSEETNSINVLP